MNFGVFTHHQNGSKFCHVDVSASGAFQEVWHQMPFYFNVMPCVPPWTKILYFQAHLISSLEPSDCWRIFNFIDATRERSSNLYRVLELRSNTRRRRSDLSGWSSAEVGSIAAKKKTEKNCSLDMLSCQIHDRAFKHCHTLRTWMSFCKMMTSPLSAATCRMFRAVVATASSDARFEIK